MNLKKNKLSENGIFDRISCECLSKLAINWPHTKFIWPIFLKMLTNPRVNLTKNQSTTEIKRQNFIKNSPIDSSINWTIINLALIIHFILKKVIFALVYSKDSTWLSADIKQIAHCVLVLVLIGWFLFIKFARMMNHSYQFSLSSKYFVMTRHFLSPVPNGKECVAQIKHFLSLF
jgi:hypothetical protein